MMFRFEQAAARCDFQLTYARGAPHEFRPDGMHGPDIADAYRPGFYSSGDWDADAPVSDTDMTVDEYIDHYAGMAVSEAVHEALEWFRVDGDPWLDPHGPVAAAIEDSVARLVEELVSLRHVRGS